jgi:2-keto-4-pentenoate hydratase/2-oxohepta-3-ene-1,7-dioic acid hydratase in catechol pathway
MRLCTFDFGDGPLPGVVLGDEVGDLSSIHPTMEGLIEGWDVLRPRVETESATVPRYALAEVRLLAPLQPASLRDFLAFEDHAKAGAARRGEELNPAWYEIPVYYKGNHRSIIGPDEALEWPGWTEKLDFECEVACVVGRHVRRASVDEEDANIFGYTIMNDWSARDVQRAEMAMRLGPARSKDFATSLGPWIVTSDSFDPSLGLQMRARVDGEVWFETAGAKMHWTFAQMISYVSQGEEVFPGDVYGSGTAYGGCGLDQDRWIQRGSTVELEVDGLGTLRNHVV